MEDLKIIDYRNLFIGLDKKVPILSDKEIVPINFDNAATTPVFKSVLKEITKACELYGAIGRGLGQKSEYSTKLFLDSRNYILKFFNGSHDKYTVIFVSNTTEGINRLSNILIERAEDIIITTRMEHHSNDLPWREKCNLKYIEVDSLGRLKLDELEDLLERYNGLVKYVSLTAASNVTGYINDINYICNLVHKYNAKLIVDGAQIVAHKKIDLTVTPIDYLVFSAHKIYAPFGSGAIIGLKDEFQRLNSDFKGGGTVEAVLDSSQIYLLPPEKDEAGSPNFFGAIALVQSLKELEKIGFDTIEKNEQILLNHAICGLKSINNIISYGDNDNISDRLGIAVFNIKDIYHAEVARLLASLRAIAVRQGAFCAHPYVKRLLGLSEDESSRYLVDSTCTMPGMVRVSFGLYNSIDEIDVFLNTLELICKLRY
ncbi:aminotransferase class V-fold PLP-dependent enzyme [Clostridium sartagoforme]|uniref:Aminotransferase class V-fold PLP-dependent enzyme n=1 Tax=Clostridium sartagoforme TaxID=84031 RepID=A0A4S2DQ44_9CLOT|nr:MULTISPECIES: aminotransferase class V-fold PLP-dependent enzyme [Clostridium]MBS5937230.1 aminotransferase class V-fold PLP-dependent enzyme [Clostridium sp.]TGY43264.1 aminotransferase class V-fold PLP-dependent enzyme [Clostridium sartagoforme]